MSVATDWDEFISRIINNSKKEPQWVVGNRGGVFYKKRRPDGSFTRVYPKLYQHKKLGKDLTFHETFPAKYSRYGGYSTSLVHRMAKFWEKQRSK